MNNQKYHIFIIESENREGNKNDAVKSVKNPMKSIDLRNEHGDLILLNREAKNRKNWLIETFGNFMRKKIKLRNLPICFLILSSSILLSFPTILLPQHDGIKAPDYWYELMVNVNLTFNLSWVLAVFYDGKKILKIPSIATLAPCLRLYFASVLSFDVIYYISHLTWTRVFGYNYPIPFANLAVYLSSFVFLVTLWYEFPERLRADKTERNRIFAYILCYLWYAIVGLQKNGLRMMFVKIPLRLQWFMAIILPIYRKFNMWVMNNIVARWVSGTSKKDLLIAKSYVNIYMNCNYALFIAISIGSTASITTSYCILTVEFIINLKNCWKIINLNRSKEKNRLARQKLKEKQQEAIVMLALTEILEILVPLAYTMTFVIAYFGPNAEILGNIRNDYWQYHEIRYPAKILFTIFQMFCFDTASAIIGGMLLWNFSNVNLWKEFNKVLTSFWPLIALRIAQITSKVKLRLFNNNNIVHNFVNMLNFMIPTNTYAFYSVL